MNAEAAQWRILANIKFVLYCKVDTFGPLYSNSLEILGDKTNNGGLYFIVVDYSIREWGTIFLDFIIAVWVIGGSIVTFILIRYRLLFLKRWKNSINIPYKRMHLPRIDTPNLLSKPRSNTIQNIAELLSLVETIIILTQYSDLFLLTNKLWDFLFLHLGN